MTDYIIPLLLAGVALFALGRRENVYEELLTGAAGGLKLLVSIVPALIALLTAVHMLRASGAMEAAASFLSPVFSFLGIPPETAALVLVRPISGSAALAVGADLMAQYGPDSPIGRTAAIMLAVRRQPFTPSASTLAPPVCAGPDMPSLQRFWQISPASAWLPSPPGCFSEIFSVLFPPHLV